jgi:endonuclease/exonuclease/phosphatase family metal-dependent hydrolase
VFRARFFLVVVAMVAFGCGERPAIDAGVDAGSDAGVDAGSDGGHDGGTDAGLDGGTDAGFDAGLDAGTDAGFDGGTDAGSSDAGLDGGGDAGWDGGGVDAGVGCALASGAGAPVHVRVVAANLSSGNLQSWDPGEGQRILQGLNPDVVMMQEFNFGTGSPADIAAFVEATFPDAGYSYTRGTGSIPNGVLSRWPLVASGEWTDPRVGNRTFDWARIDLPGPRDLFAVSVHLLTSSASERNLEAAALIAQLDAGVGAGELFLVGGDFNTDTRAEACLSTLQPWVSEAQPYPADQAGIEGTNASRARPYDHVLESRCLALSETTVVIGASQFDGGLVFDSRVYVPLSDVAPVLATDSAATNMQHMAVVRDYLVQP